MFASGIVIDNQLCMDISMQMITLPGLGTDSPGMPLQASAQDGPAAGGFMAALEGLFRQDLDEAGTDKKDLSVLLNMFSGFNPVPDTEIISPGNISTAVSGEETGTADDTSVVQLMISTKEGVSLSVGSASVVSAQAFQQKPLHDLPTADNRSFSAENKIPVVHDNNKPANDTGRLSSVQCSVENILKNISQKRNDGVVVQNSLNGKVPQNALPGLTNKQEGATVINAHAGLSLEQENGGPADEFNGKDFSSKNQDALQFSVGKEGSSGKPFSQTLINEDAAMPETVLMNRGQMKTGENFEVREIRQEVRIPEPLNISRADLSRGDITSLKVSIAPEGIGELDIELVLNRGMINGHINASESAGKAAIEKNLHSIVDNLIKDGINIGGVSVSLREKRDETMTLITEDREGLTPVKKITGPCISMAGNGLINIYV